MMVTRFWLGRGLEGLADEELVVGSDEDEEDELLGWVSLEAMQQKVIYI